MKHVSRVLFGFSIVAVLALFTACPQAADTKKDSGTTLKNELNLTAKTALSALGSVSGLTIDADKGTITIPESSANSISIAQAHGEYTLKEVKIPAKKSVSSKVEGTNVVLTVMGTASGKDEISVILVLTKGTGKDLKTSEIPVKLINKKKQADQPSVTAESLKKLATDKKDELKTAIENAIKANSGETATGVKSNFTIVPPAGFDGVTFEWSTDKTDNLRFTGNEAAVTRPESGTTNAECKILVKLTKGAVSMTETVEVTSITVLKQD